MAVWLKENAKRQILNREIGIGGPCELVGWLDCVGADCGLRAQEKGSIYFQFSIVPNPHHGETAIKSRQ